MAEKIPYLILGLFAAAWIGYRVSGAHEAGEHAALDQRAPAAEQQLAAPSAVRNKFAD
jgi:hypothetical protein